MAVSGRAWIVGAGPGDPGLLTRRAVACLKRADLVLYDALVDTRVLRFARRARRFYVGKRAHRHAMTQEAINTWLVRAVRRGWRVVRLKGGDPFVFGRGGEEALALAAAGLRFDVVPGVSSAIAAPAAAGIPVTHRGVASAFMVVSGHDLSAFDAVLGAAAPDAVTLVVLMGLSQRQAIAERLIARGWHARTPAAVILGAWTHGEHVWRGSLADLTAEPVQCASDIPNCELPAGTLVVGRVAALCCADAARAVASAAAAAAALQGESARGGMVYGFGR